MRSGLEIQAALTAFVAKWSGYEGSEKAEAQTFPNELFAAYGSDRTEVGAKFEDFVNSVGFMDLHWPGVLIVEMKAPFVPLEKAKDQRRRYWQESSNSAENIQAALREGMPRDYPRLGACAPKPNQILRAWWHVNSSGRGGSLAVLPPRPDDMTGHIDQSTPTLGELRADNRVRRINS